ncbi:cytoplasmic protein [Nocardioides dongxiaopingii]|uniref:cytoplasmic protein n=1 Tax=Nocardioides dongxiaopingii TaxID=2576036 RepID=UPI0010C76340|nr:cytoplasmic protein [Nocardioides dongxiaopingii]
MSPDPVESLPQHYRVVLENERVRVLEYTDHPGQQTTTHRHPDSVMITLSSFRRTLRADDSELDVELSAGTARWLDAQEHSGHNTGDTDTHVMFVELKEPAGHGPRRPVRLGPTD